MDMQATARGFVVANDRISAGVDINGRRFDATNPLKIRPLIHGTRYAR